MSEKSKGEQGGRKIGDYFDDIVKNEGGPLRERQPSDSEERYMGELEGKKVVVDSYEQKGVETFATVHHGTLTGKWKWDWRRIRVEVKDSETGELGFDDSESITEE